MKKLSYPARPRPRPIRLAPGAIRSAGLRARAAGRHAARPAAAAASLAIHLLLLGAAAFLGLGDGPAPRSPDAPVEVVLEPWTAAAPLELLPPETLPSEPPAEPPPAWNPYVAPDLAGDVAALAAPLPPPPPPAGDVEVILVSEPPPGAGAPVDAGTAAEYWTRTRARIAAALRYPPYSAAAGVGGVVWVDLLLDGAGNPVSVEVGAEAPAPLARAALAAVRAAAPFDPPGPGVPRRARIPIRFAPEGP